MPIVDRLDVAFEPWRWPFADERRAEIDAYFVGVRARTPEIWNGTVLMTRDPVLSGCTFRARCFATDYASFVAWRDWGAPDREVFNGFGMGALRSRDGAFMLGEMSRRTANAGRIYFPAGMLDETDIKDGRIDIAGNVAREVAEETGLAEHDYVAAGTWTFIQTRERVALIRVLDVPLTGDALHARLTLHLAADPTSELAAFHSVRDEGDLKPAIQDFVATFLIAQFANARALAQTKGGV